MAAPDTISSTEGLPPKVRQRQLSARSVNVWRIVAAHPKGVHFNAVEEMLRPRCTVTELKSCMQSLRESAYVRFAGHHGRWGLWHITEKPPLGETMPQWKLDALYGEAETEPATPPVAGVPAGVANSVFRLAVVETTMGSAPAEGVPTFTGVNIDAPTAERVFGTRAAAQQQQAARFSLCSDGVFTIEHGDTDPISLPPSVTRQMFRWLDRIGGMQLTQMLEVQP